MPNTLAHIAIQAAATNATRRSNELVSLSLLGCVIPDIPWILQRALHAAPMTVDPYALRAYATVQASLFFSVVLAGACSFLFFRAVRAFMIMSAGCVLHLCLDATEIKWGSGVNLFAPFDWHLMNWGIVWPEHTLVVVTSICGIGIFAYYGLRSWPESTGLFVNRRRTVGCVTVTVVYILLPFAFISGPFQSDSYYVSTLSHVDDRNGKSVVLDRASVFSDGHAWLVKTYAGEFIRIEHFEPDNGGTYSLQGKFMTANTISVSGWHRHDNFRDLGSMLGLALILFWVLLAVYRHRWRGA